MAFGLNKTVKGIHIPIEGDTTSLGKALKETEQNIRSLTKEMKQIDSALKHDPKNTELLAQQYRVAGEQVENLKHRLDVLKEADKNLKSQLEKGEISQSFYDEFRRALINTETDLEKYTNKQRNANKVMEETKTSSGIFVESMHEARKEVVSFSDILKASVLGDIISTGIKKAASSIRDFGELAISSAISFESSFANVEKTVNATDEELQQIKDTFQEMSKEIPATVEGISEVAGLAGQLGIEVESITGFAEAMLGLEVATNMTAEAAATALAQFANITKMSQDNFDRLGSSVVALGNKFATQESNIVNMAQRFAGAGSAAGLAEADILGMSAAVASLGISEQIGGTNLSKVFQDIQIAVETTSEELADFAHIANMSAEEFTRAFKDDAAMAFHSFVEGLGDIERTGKSTIVLLDELGYKESGMNRMLQALAGNADLLKNAIEISNQAWKENIALQDEVGIFYGTTENQLQVLSNRLTSVSMNIGEKVLPSIVDLKETFVSFVEENEESLISMAESITHFLESLIDFAPVAISLVEGLGAAFATWKIGSTVSKAASEIAKLSVSATGLGTALASALGPLGVATLGIGAAVTALGLASNAWKNYKEKQEEARQSMIFAHETLEELEGSLLALQNKDIKLSGLLESHKDLSKEIQSRRLNSEELTKAEEDLSIIEEELMRLSDGYITKQEIENGLTDEKIDKVYELIKLETELAEVELMRKVSELQSQDLEGEINRVIERKEKLIEREEEIQKAINCSKEIYLEYHQIVNDESLSGEERARNIALLKDEFLRLQETMDNVNGFDWSNVDVFFSQDLLKSLANGHTLLVSVKEEIIELTKEEEHLQLSQQLLIEYTERLSEAHGEEKEAIEQTIESLEATKAAYEGYIKNIENAVNQSNQLANSTGELVETLGQETKDLYLLEEAYNKVTQGGALTHEELVKLMAVYPEMSQYVKEHGFALETDAEIFANISSDVREGRQRNIEAAIIEAEATITEMEAQAEAARINYSAIISMLMAVEEARSMQSGIAAPVSGISKEELEAIKEQQELIEKEIENAKENKKKLEEALAAIQSIETKAYSGSSSRGGSARTKAKQAEVNELLDIEWKAYEQQKKYNELTLEDSLLVLEQMKMATKATGKDLEKIEYEQYQIREQLKKEEAESINQFGDALAEARKRQVTEVFDYEKSKRKEAAAEVKSITYEKIDLEGELGKITLNRIDDEYWAKATALMDEIQSREELSQLLENDHFDRVAQIEKENLATLRGLDEEIDKHWEIIELTNQELARDLQANQDRQEALNEEEEREREALEEKRNAERELAIQERIRNAETDEERRKAIEEMASFEEELARRLREKDRQAERKDLQAERKELTKTAKSIIDQELEDIEKIISTQEEGLKRISESVGVEQLEALEVKMKEYLEGAEAYAVALVESGEDGQEKALKILEKYYPDWNEKGKKFVDYLTDGMKEKMPDLLETARRMGREAGRAFASAFDASSSTSRGDELLESVSFFNASLSGQSLQSFSAMAPTVYQAAENLGVRTPSVQQTEEKEVNITYENHFSANLPQDLPSVVERAQKQNNRQLKYDLGVI